MTASRARVLCPACHSENDEVFSFLPMVQDFGFGLLSYRQRGNTFDDRRSCYFATVQAVYHGVGRESFGEE
ncbi:unnamed protein product [Pylaiella littoralis]